MSDPSPAMGTGSAAGAPGDHLPDPPEDAGEVDAELERAVEDDAPLPAEGGPQQDGLEVEFREPS